jgi:hypothetical protein
MASEFEESSKFEGSPKLSTNSGPVAWMTIDGVRVITAVTKAAMTRGSTTEAAFSVPLYAAPPAPSAAKPR